ncbi:MAG: hypothetical protein NVS3B20_26700 [Polyangiales bacterium]
MHTRDNLSAAKQPATPTRDSKLGRRIQRHVEEAAHARQNHDGDAFVPDPHSGPTHVRDDLAESLAEEFLSSATSAQETTEDHRDQVLTEELGGPFIQGLAEEEFSHTVDETNPANGTREPFPTANRRSSRS